MRLPLGGHPRDRPTPAPTSGRPLVWNSRRSAGGVNNGTGKIPAIIAVNADAVKALRAAESRNGRKSERKDFAPEEAVALADALPESEELEVKRRREQRVMVQI